jgi:predicted small metal-binding protein
MTTEYEFTCSDEDDHSFHVKTEDREDLINTVQTHAKNKHDMTMTREDVEEGIQEV